MNCKTVASWKSVVSVSISLLCFSLDCFAAEPLGYTWPKNTLLVTNTTPSRFNPLKNGGTYPLLIELKSGYSIVCDGADSRKQAAFLPLRDRLGNPLLVEVVSNGNSVLVSSRFVLSGDALDLVDLKPGIIPLHSGSRYAALNKSENRLSVEFPSAVLTQTVEVSGADVEFMTLTEYKSAVNGVLTDLRKQAETLTANGDYLTAIMLLNRYSGKFAEDTVADRQKIVEAVSQQHLSLEKKTAEEERKATEEKRKAAEQAAEERRREEDQRAKVSDLELSSHLKALKKRVGVGFVNSRTVLFRSLNASNVVGATYSVNDNSTSMSVMSASEITIFLSASGELPIQQTQILKECFEKALRWKETAENNSVPYIRKELGSVEAFTTWVRLVFLYQVAPEKCGIEISNKREIIGGELKNSFMPIAEAGNLVDVLECALTVDKLAAPKGGLRALVLESGKQNEDLFR